MLASLLLEKITSETEPAVRYEQRSCLRNRFNKNECRNCLSECRAGAVTLSGRTIAFDAEKCTECMRCVAVCPNDAFMADFNPLQLLKSVEKNDLVFISCRKEKPFESVETVPCIGSLSNLLLAAMNSLTKGEIFLDATQCNNCINGHCLEKIELSLKVLRAKKSESHKKIKLKLIPDESLFPKVDSSAARRYYLKGAGKALAEFGIETYNKAHQDNYAEKQNSQRGPTKESVALQYALENTLDEEEKKALMLYYYTVQASNQCNTCPVCSGMCPTGALKRIKENGEKHLVFRSSDCSGCGLCRDFCNKQALFLNKGFTGDTKEPLRLI